MYTIYIKLHNAHLCIHIYIYIIRYIYLHSIYLSHHIYTSYVDRRLHRFLLDPRYSNHATIRRHSSQFGNLQIEAATEDSGSNGGQHDLDAIFGICCKYLAWTGVPDPVWRQGSTDQCTKMSISKVVDSYSGRMWTATLRLIQVTLTADKLRCNLKKFVRKEKAPKR